MKAALLPDRGVVKVSGETARDFLNGLLTADMTRLAPGQGRFGALLTPQDLVRAPRLAAAPEACEGLFEELGWGDPSEPPGQDDESEY